MRWKHQNFIMSCDLDTDEFDEIVWQKYFLREEEQQETSLSVAEDCDKQCW